MEEKITLSFQEIPYVHIADHVVDTKPFRHADRKLEYHVLIYVLKGCMPVVEEGVEYSLTPGTLFFLKGGLHHWGEHFITNGSSWVYVHFTLKEAPEDQLDFVAYTTHIQNQEFTADSYRFKVMLPKIIRLVNGNLIEGKLLQLAELFHSGNPVRAPYLNFLMGEILFDCYQYQNIPKNIPDKDHVFKMIHYLENHTHMALHSKELEEYMNLSYKHLCTIFKRKTGLKPVEYHTNLRMNEAAKLLRETSMRINEISDFMGYSDQLYFSNVFKKVHSMSPKNYRIMKK